MYGNWTRKTGGFALFALTAIVYWRVFVLRESVNVLTEYAPAAALIIGLMAGKSNADRRVDAANGGQNG